MTVFRLGDPIPYMPNVPDASELPPPTPAPNNQLTYVPNGNDTDNQRADTTTGTNTDNQQADSSIGNNTSNQQASNPGEQLGKLLDTAETISDAASDPKGFAKEQLGEVGKAIGKDFWAKAQGIPDENSTAPEDRPATQFQRQLSDLSFDNVYKGTQDAWKELKGQAGDTLSGGIQRLIDMPGQVGQLANTLFGFHSQETNNISNSVKEITSK